ncbi:rhodanese-like domain-containing protein, partial [Mycolicibacterium elephantis]
MSYAGDITPEEAWTLLTDVPEAVLVDCRTEAEWRFVGVPDLATLGRDVVFIEWNRTDGTHNEAFVDDLVEKVGETADRPVVFLCRSG